MNSGVKMKAFYYNAVFCVTHGTKSVSGFFSPVKVNCDFGKKKKEKEKNPIPNPCIVVYSLLLSVTDMVTKGDMVISKVINRSRKKSIL